ncbi:hypothetical protein NEOLEDRAFT_138775 [Neolentinus lepideus HHB14362 ss-1]|uniref:Mitochondrial ribosomal protein subunit L20-domain-containing protein n=1 Tax=Neolentinus lepideus HHB14362 ss-1 TaxID=1314782 RepID=A0A165TZ55_9AGAM|nr:hypothetical protein NEOLEDRAFT_138775 [Neolentinus lepideus HHB14362 ss-1]
MKPQLRAPRLAGLRHYATRVTLRKPMPAERPPQKYPDPLSKSPNAVNTPLEGNLTFIHRPPPSSPSPFSYTTSPISPLLRPPTGHSPQGVPPYIRPSAKKDPPPRMSDANLAELKRLRLEDPKKWTRAELARKFNCTTQFVGMVTKVPNALRKEIKREKAQMDEEARTKWGPRRRMVREIAKKKREFW